MGAILSLSGGRKLIRTFELLPVKVQRRAARGAVARAARMMVKEVKSTVDRGSHKAVDSGLLQKSIGFRMWTSKTGFWAVGATIGPRKGFGTLVVRSKKGKEKALTRGGIAKVVAAGGSFARAQYADPAKYAHFVERGTKERAGGRGAVRGVRFMQHSYLRSRDVMAGTLRTEIRNGIEHEARKLVKA